MNLEEKIHALSPDVTIVRFEKFIRVSGDARVGLEIL